MAIETQVEVTKQEAGEVSSGKPVERTFRLELLHNSTDECWLTTSKWQPIQAPKLKRSQKKEVYALIRQIREAVRRA